MTNSGGHTACGHAIVEHPSDVGIEAWGETLGEAFVQAANGMLSIITERENIRENERRTIVVASTDYENLLVKWLSELIYVYDGEHFLPAVITIDSLTPAGLSATLTGEHFDASRHPALLDIKAVTYHQVMVDAARKTVRVFFDV
jgi:SHS2 domain-containing protein